jgi:DNA-binding NtrC family response regulator
VSLHIAQFALPQRSEAHKSQSALAERVHSFEREVILAEPERSRHHITKTAKVLELAGSHLYKKAGQLGIDLQALRDEPRF